MDIMEGKEPPLLLRKTTLALKRQLKKLVLRGGVLYRKVVEEDDVLYQLVLPSLFRSVALRGCHEEMGHLGGERTLGVVRERFYWPSVAEDVLGHVSRCARCVLRKSQGSKVSMKSIISGHPMESLEPSQGAP